MVMKRLTGSRIGNLVVVFAVSIIPLLYAGLLTLAYQNPTNRVGDIHAAVVNEDSAYTATLVSGDTQTLNLGHDLEQALTNPQEGENVGFTWQSMSAAEAQAAMDTQEIRAILTIPAGLSERIALLGSEDPSAAATQELSLVTDDGINYLAGTMATTVASELSKQLSAQGADRVLDTLLLSISTIRDGMVTAGSGASQLADGSSTLAQGTTTLSEGATRLDSGAQSLTVGIRQLANGSVTLSSGLGTLADGAATAASGSQQLSDGVARLAAGASSAAEGSSALSDGAAQLAAGTNQLASQSAILGSGVSQLSTGAATLNAGITQYTQGVDQAAAAAATLQARATDSSTGLAAAMAQLQAGVGTPGSTDTSTLTGGTAALSAGAAQLSAGLSQPGAAGTSLNDGAAALAQGLTQASAGVDQYTAAVDQLAAACQASGDTSATCQALAQLASQSAGLRSGVAQSASAANQVSAGVSQAATGAQQLATASATLEQGTALLSAGLDQAALVVGQPTDVTVPGDATSPQTLLGGINALSGGLSQLQANSAALTSGASQLSGGLGIMNASVPALTNGVTRLDAGAQSLATGANTLNDGLGTLATGSATAATSSQALADGMARLLTGANSAADGANTLSSGLATADSGAQQLADGSSQLATGATTLDEGAQRLASGAQTLSDGIEEGAERIPNYTDAQRETMSRVASDPVEVDAIRENAVANNGAGFTPMFMSLALWIGAIALFLVLPALDKRDHGERWWASAIRPATTAALLAVVQAAVMMIVVNALGELHAANLPGLIGMAMVTSLVFMAINQACVATLAFRGRFVSIILLSLQITSMGGTFPIETTPRFFQWIHPFLPMSYTQLSFRRLIAGGGLDGIYWQTLAVLVTWGVIAVAFIFLGAKLRRGSKPLPADNALAPTAGYEVASA